MEMKRVTTSLRRLIDLGWHSEWTDSLAYLNGKAKHLCFYSGAGSKGE